MRALRQEDVIRIMREEWSARVAALAEAIDMSATAKVGKDGEQLVIAPGLKVKHKQSGLKYTVDSVSPRDVILKTPEGDKFLLDNEDLESEYELE